jgi:hypothetical protein
MPSHQRGRGYLCGPCLRSALDIRGPCPGCAAVRALPGRRPSDQAPICRDCAGISRYFTCLHATTKETWPAAGSATRAPRPPR